MRVLALLTAGLFAGSLVAADDKKDEKKVKDGEAILGTWKAEKIEGLPNSPSIDLAKMRMTFKEDGKMVVIDPDGQEITKGYKPDPSAKPKAIDITDDKLKALALYELDGDTLKYCLQFGRDKPRPTEIKANEEQWIYVITLKRVKDEKKDK